MTFRESQPAIPEMPGIPVINIRDNAVLGDQELQSNIMMVNPDFGALCINTAGYVYGKQKIDQKTKVLIAIAVDIVEQITGGPFHNHMEMAKKQGITKEEIEELLLFMCVYSGFNKVGIFYTELEKFYRDVN